MFDSNPTEGFGENEMNLTTDFSDDHRYREIVLITDLQPELYSYPCQSVQSVV